MSAQKTGAGIFRVSDAGVSQSETNFLNANLRECRMGFEHARNGRDFVPYKSSQSLMWWAGLRFER